MNALFPFDLAQKGLDCIFADSIELAQQKGIRAVIQSGGSIRDEAMIRLANELGLVMLFTGTRHFKH